MSGNNDDTLPGGSNDDTVSGGGNDDTIPGGNSDDTIPAGNNDPVFTIENPDVFPEGPILSNDYSALNNQIVAAVDKTNSIVLGVAETEAIGIAAQKITQAAGLAVQDATDYMRNIMTMSAAAQGVCLQLMIESNDPEKYATIMTDAQTAVTEATKAVTAAGTAAKGFL